MLNSFVSALAFAAAASAVALPLADKHHGRRHREFDPYSYQKTSVECKAVERSETSDVVKDITLNLKYIDINPTAKKTIVMTHGWPSMWTTWRHQIKHFEKDYRIILPEIRGYGDSEHPAEYRASSSFNDVVNDILCMLEHAGVENSICLGHDYGAQICWEAGRMRPDVFIGVANGAVPYVSASGGFIPTAVLRNFYPHFGYQTFLENITYAAAELDHDIRGLMRSVHLYANTSFPKSFLEVTDTFLGPWYEQNKEQNLTEIPRSGLLPQKVEDYMVENWSKQSTRNTFNGYQDPNRNISINFDKAQGNFTLSQPTLMIFPTADPVADWILLAKTAGSSHFLTNHYNATLPTSHFIHEELPHEFNAIVDQWIGNVTWPAA